MFISFAVLRSPLSRWPVSLLTVGLSLLLLLLLPLLLLVLVLLLRLFLLLLMLLLPLLMLRLPLLIVSHLRRKHPLVTGTAQPLAFVAVLAGPARVHQIRTLLLLLLLNQGFVAALGCARRIRCCSGRCRSRGSADGRC